MQRRETNPEALDTHADRHTHTQQRQEEEEAQADTH